MKAEQLQSAAELTVLLVTMTFSFLIPWLLRIEYQGPLPMAEHFQRESRRKLLLSKKNDIRTLKRYRGFVPTQLRILPGGSDRINKIERVCAADVDDEDCLTFKYISDLEADSIEVLEWKDGVREYFKNSEIVFDYVRPAMGYLSLSVVVSLVFLLLKVPFMLHQGREGVVGGALYVMSLPYLIIRTIATRLIIIGLQKAIGAIVYLSFISLGVVVLLRYVMDSLITRIRDTFEDVSNLNSKED